METQMQRRTDLAYIKPALLTWAINRSGLTRADICKQLHLQPRALEAYEKGLGSPLFNKALEMSRVLRIPFGYFFLSQPPADEVPIPDLRTLSGKPVTQPSPDFLEVLSQALTQHDWYKAYLAEEGAPVLSFVSQFALNDSIEEVARDIATHLKIDQALRREARTWEGYLTKLSQQAERAGIIVMRRGVVGSSRRKLNREEFQGFALVHSQAPFVFINGQDFESAKIFTLIHELAHIWIGQSGISKAEEVLSSEQMLDVEVFCNAVAAEALVPKEEFLGQWKTIPDGYEKINALARHFLVSAFVIIRRAREFNRIDYPTYEAFLEEANRRTQPKGKPSGANFYTTLDARNSPTLVDALVFDVKRDGTAVNEAAKLLSVRSGTIASLLKGGTP
jgi:Zn-dependent peptidase ImmA (M78 family)/DNA-binding XRE family transcriptional regulator